MHLKLLAVATLVLLAGCAGRTAMEAGSPGLADGFRLTAFGNEFRAGFDFIRKFTAPVHVRLETDVEKTPIPAELARLAARVNGFTGRQIFAGPENDSAGPEILVGFRARRDNMDRARQVYGTSGRGQRVARMIEFASCAFEMNAPGGELRVVHVFINDNGNDTMHANCVHEEVTQALGLPNDNSSLSLSMFNDTGGVDRIGTYDLCLVAMLYDPRIRPGMTPDEVMPLLPAVIADLPADCRRYAR
ncbi:MAG: DUF2927 domain-containing protein [Pseudomonadota bacterium]|nr:DUF2927 domain-containing protein [Pseudomonadota bacterium]